MADACTLSTLDTGLVNSLLTSTDCSVRSMTAASYGALAQGGSPMSAILTAMLTLYIAFIGYRMMIGRTPLRVGDMTVSALKIGAVLAFVTSWATYQHVVFNTLFLGPEQLGRAVLEAIPASGGGSMAPFAQLQTAFDQTQTAAAFFARISLPSTSPMLGGVPFAAFAINAAGYLMVLSTLGLILAAKIVLGLLLAIGPAFIACLLFDATRGLFEGWLRATIAFALMPLIAQLALIVQMGLAGPPLTRLAHMSLAGTPDTSDSTGVFILTLITCAVSLGGVIGVGIVAAGFRLPWAASAAAQAEGGRLARAREPTVAQTAAAQAPAQFRADSRAAAVAAAATAMDRRETRVSATTAAAGERREAMGRARPEPASIPGLAFAPLGQTYRRAAQPRRAASNQRRDR